MGLPRTTFERWLYALKPASWPKLCVPALLGQAIGLDVALRPSATAALLGAAFTVLDLAFIVLLNDWGDRNVDAIKRRMFPEGCSPKTIPDGILPAGSLLAAGLAAGAGAAAVAFVAEDVVGRPGLGTAGLFCLFLFVAYTLPPLRLNYRGGGELVEAFGVGVVLPWLHAYLQGGELLPPLLVLLPGSALLAFSSAVASGLGDEMSDRAGGKRTVATLLGNRIARALVEGSLLLGALAILAAAFVPGGPAVWAVVPAAIVIGLELSEMRRIGPTAVTNAFREQGEYKRRLHRAIWRGTTLCAAVVAALSFLSG
jgi:1,4-dihydroxy-2-naphthoate octaprenyltransferase/chlorophyll synthase